MASQQTAGVTYALLHPETAAAAAAALGGATGKAEVEGLVELLYAPPSARAAVVAVSALDASNDPVVVDALIGALDSPHSSVRAVAVQSLHRRRARRAGEPLLRLLRRDESWVVRRAALLALADRPEPGCWQVVAVAGTDPHWRVRHALIQVLLQRGDTAARRWAIDERLAGAGPDARVQGVRDYLRYRWSGCPPTSAPAGGAEDPSPSYPFWDWDPAVLARNLERLGEPGRRQALDVMPYLAGNPDERVRALALDALRAGGEARHIARVLTLLDEPRDGTGESVGKLLASLDPDRTAEVARFVLHLSGPSPAQLAWALDQVGVVLEPDEEQSILAARFLRAAAQPVAVRAALARLATRWADPRAEGWLRGFLEDPEPEVRLAALRGLNRMRARLGGEVLRRLVHAEDPGVRAEVVGAVIGEGDRSLTDLLAEDPDARVRGRLAELLAAGGGDWLARLRVDPHPHVRAAALTPARAAELVQDPGRETSWHVLAKAARLARVPLWELEPAPPWQPERSPQAGAERLRLNRAAPPHARVLGPGGPAVSPLGISGHYGLPVEGFVRAVEAGVNLLFWEPNYQTLTEFAGRLAGADRNALHFVTGTFEADGRRVRRDAERALRLLQIDRIALFLLFWVRSWERVSPDVREALGQLKAGGQVAAFGLSTHSRPLAVEAMEAGWNPVMVRHSAAHRGAEAEVLPRAVERGTSVLSFNNTCYGRLLRARGDIPPPGAADCYRYTLAQPGVTACWSAPATLDQLGESLAALRDLALPPARRELLRRLGDLVYEEDAVFRKLVRSR